MLVYWNNNPQVDMLLHSDTLCWFRSDQLLFRLKFDSTVVAFINFAMQRNGQWWSVMHTFYERHIFNFLLVPKKNLCKLFILNLYLRVLIFDKFMICISVSYYLLFIITINYLLKINKYFQEKEVSNSVLISYKY